MKQIFLKKTNQALLVALVCVILFPSIFLSVPMAITQSSSDTTVYAEPSYKEIIVNETFSISVNITNVTNLFRWEFKLWYTTAHVNAISVTEGPFLKADSAQTTFGIGQMNDAYNATHGLIWAICRQKERVGMNGSGVLAIVSFKATSLGSSDLLLAYPGRPYPVTLTDPQSQIITCSAIGGTVEVKSSISPYSPKASFTVPPATLYTGYSLTFNASASEAGCNGTHLMPIVWYYWNFGDGATSNETDPIANHTYTKVGNYTVTLTVYAPGAIPETDTTTSTTRVIRPTMVFVDPPLRKVTINQTFSVSVKIANVTNLYAYEFKLYYDRTILNGISVDIPIDHFLKPTDVANFFVAHKEINDTLGLVWVAATLLNPELPKNGSGILAKITFKATALGSSNLTLYYPNYKYPVKLGDAYMNIIPCTVTSETVNVIALLGDINGDEIIDIFDIAIWANAFGSQVGDSNWNPDVDLVPNNLIDIFDGVTIAINFGKTRTP